MNIKSLKSYRLPPLPNRSSNMINMIIQSQKVNLVEKYANSEAVDVNQFVTSSSNKLKLSNRRPSLKRPLSTKSTQSRDSRQNSVDSADVTQSSKRHPVSIDKYTLSLEFPNVTAKSWVIYQMKHSKYIRGKRNFKRRQIASLTKMMNLITILQLVEELNLNAHKLKVRVSPQAASMTGTTAELKSNAQLSLNDLYYAMMLPSGNDAAWQIAQIGGSLLMMMRQKGRIDHNIAYNIASFTQYYQSLPGNIVNAYLNQMNRTAKKLFMNSSNFANPHGLSNTSSFSTAEDVARLCIHAMKNSQFRRIVNTKQYNCTYQIFQEKEEITVSSSNLIQEDKENYIKFSSQKCIKSAKLKYRWQNTNRMLGEGWSGIKTGITPNAGPCLAASCCKTIQGKQYQFLVILLNSESMEHRWQQVKSLVKWAIDNNVYV